jgi:hypothetical protein
MFLNPITNEAQDQVDNRVNHIVMLLASEAE